jgi:hypothetical protein
MKTLPIVCEMNSNTLSIPTEQQKLNSATPNVSSSTPNPQNEQTLMTSNFNKSWQFMAAREPFSWNDIHSLKFVIQTVFSTIILLFCLCQLSMGNSKNEAIYWSGVTGILGLWIPSPSSTSANQKSQANIGSVNNPQIKIDSTD